MKTGDRSRFSSVLGTVAIISGVAISDDLLIDTYFKALSDLSIEEIEKAGTILIQTWKEARLPSPAQWREVLQGNIEEQAENAFQLCLKHSRFDDSVQFADNAITIAIERMGGWAQWCDWCRWMPEDQFQWQKKAWLKHYATAKRLGQKPSNERFIGYVEQQSRLSEGYGTPQLLLVSNDGKVEQKQITAGGVHSFKEIAAKAKEEVTLPEFTRSDYGFARDLIFSEPERGDANTEENEKTSAQPS